MAIDSYMLDIAEKDASSALLAELALPTLDTPYVHQVVPGKNGLSFLKIPEEYLLVGHSSGGDYSLRDSGDYAASVFRHLLADSERIGAVPVAVADVIDAQKTDEEFVRSVGVPFAKLALENRVAIMNGELAKLGPMVNCGCNISGTMLSLLPRDSPLSRFFPEVLEIEGTKYFVFDPKGKFVWMNSDGVGTKSLVYARFREYMDAVNDLFAMQFDDKGKFGGGAIASFNLVEVAENFPFRSVDAYAQRLAANMGAFAVMQKEFVGNRLVGPHGEENAFNMSGTLVSLVDEAMINSRPQPREGDALIAINGYGRSNGFTDRRNLVVDWFGENWHLTAGGKYFGEFLTIPSTIFYPVFAELISKGLASSVYHMSGGAYRDKLSRPLARSGLYASIGVIEGSTPLFAPDPREAAFASFFNIKNAYAKFAMGNEGFVTTSNPQAVLAFLKDKHFEARIVSALARGERKGVKLRAFNGVDIVDFSEAA